MIKIMDDDENRVFNAFIKHNYNKQYPKTGGNTIGIIELNAYYLVAIAFCKVGDMFCKKTGREVVAEKLLSNDHITIPKNYISPRNRKFSSKCKKLEYICTIAQYFAN